MHIVLKIDNYIRAYSAKNRQLSTSYSAKNRQLNTSYCAKNRQLLEVVTPQKKLTGRSSVF